MAGNLTSITYPGTIGTVIRGYDDAGRWTSVTDFDSHTTTFGYNDDGLLTSTTFPSSVNADTYTANNADQLTGITYAQGATTLGSLSYSRDNAGQLTGETPSGVAGSTVTYGYNSLEQLTTKNSTSTWTYDSADNLTADDVGRGAAVQRRQPALLPERDRLRDLLGAADRGDELRLRRARGADQPDRDRVRPGRLRL